MKKQICLAGVISFLLMIQGCFQSHASSPNPAPKPKGKSGNLWYKTNRFQVTITHVDKRSFEAYEFRQNKSDFQLEVNSQVDNESDSGTLLVIEDVVVLIKGLKTQRRHEIDVLVANILSAKLAYALLACAFPKGPDSIRDTLDTSIVEQTNELSVNYLHAGLEIPPPWSLKGTASPVGTDHIQFDLTFTFPSSEDERVKETMLLAGKWYKNSSELEIPAEMPIQDWQILDYQAHKMHKFGTIGELRMALQTERQRQK